MKKLKKISTIIVSVCLLVFCSVFISHAADGTLQFSDPTAKAGEEVTVKVKIITDGSAVGDGNVNVKYDPAFLEFKSGENATGGNGTVSLSATGNGSQSELDYTMVFQALKEGTTTIEVENYTAYLYSDETLSLSTGNSTVTIEAGDGTTTSSTGGPASADGLKVQVEGVEYTVNENFSEAIIPAGFTASEIQLEGSAHKAMQQQSSGQYMFYLTNAEGDSDYFLYNADDASFYETELVDISDTVMIMLMDHEDTEGLPSKYQETTSNINGKEFSAWQNTEETDYFLIYALSSDGIKGYYQYDTTEGTYQRFIMPAKTNSETTSKTWLDKLQDLIDAHLPIILAVVWGIILILLILIIVLSTKLHHRNEELDDVYNDMNGNPDDYGGPAVQKKSRSQFVGHQGSDDDEYGDDEYEDDEYDDEYSDDEYDDDEYDDEYSDDEYEDDEYSDDEYEDDEYDDEYGDDEYEDDEYDDEYSDDEYEDEYDDEYSDDEYDDGLSGDTRPVDIQKKGGQEETFSLDFINLDD